MKANAREAVLLKAEVKKLKEQLELLKGTYKIRLEFEKRGFEFGEDGNVSSYEVSGVKYDAKTRAAINPKETVSQRLEREGTAPWLDKFDVGGGDEGSDAADKLEKQLEAGKQLSREFELQKDLLMAKNELQKQLVQNEFDRLEAIRQIQTTAAATQQADLIKQANEVASLERSKLIADYAKDELASAQEKIEASRLLIEADARREELIAQGINPALADSLVEIEQAYDAERKQLTVLEGILTAELARVDANSEIAKELQEQLDKIKKIQGQLDEAEQQEKGKAKGDNPGDIQAYINQAQDELMNWEKQVVRMAQTIESEFASAMSNTIIGVIDGTQTAEEAFANMFKNIGEAFIKMATEMIAKLLIIKALQAITGMTPGKGSTGVPGLEPNSYYGTGGQYGSFTPLANGGAADTATPYIVGERGPELFVPNTSGTIVSNEQSRAQLDMYSPGNAVDGPSGPMNVEMSYSGPVMAFDDKRYVPVEAIPDIIRDAAKQGEQRTLASMRNKVSTRNRVGI